jgi:hypothetical protein
MMWSLILLGSLHSVLNATVHRLFVWSETLELHTYFIMVDIHLSEFLYHIPKAETSYVHTITCAY